MPRIYNTVQITSQLARKFTSPATQIRNVSSLTKLFTHLVVTTYPRLSLDIQNRLLKSTGVTADTDYHDVGTHKIEDIAVPTHEAHRVRLATDHLHYCIFVIARFKTASGYRILSMHHNGDEKSNAIARIFAGDIDTIQKETGQQAEIITVQNIAKLSSPGDSSHLEILQRQTRTEIDTALAKYNIAVDKVEEITSSGPVIYNPLSHLTFLPSSRIEPRALIAIAKQNATTSMGR